jgi:hypothetical protein
LTGVDWKAGEAARLPATGQGLGLDLIRDNVTEAGLKELAGPR